MKTSSHPGLNRGPLTLAVMYMYAGYKLAIYIQYNINKCVIHVPFGGDGILASAFDSVVPVRPVTACETPISSWLARQKGE